MGKRLKTVVLVAMVLAIVGGLPALAQARVAYSVTKPKLSAPPVMGEAFTVSGMVKPKATTTSRTVVQIKLSMLVAGRWNVISTYRAKLTPILGGAGTAYSRRLTVPAQGAYSVRAFHYRAGKLVRKSAGGLLRCRPAHQHRLDGQRVDGARARRRDGPRRHAAGHRLHDPFGLGLGRPGVALRRRALHLGRLREGRRSRPGLAHRRPAPRPLRLDARRDAQVGHRLPGRRPADRHRQDLTCRRSRTAVPAGGHLLRRCQRRGHGL